MINACNFYYHKECYSCSVCKIKDAVYCVSTNGKTLWCKTCYEKIIQSCCYCSTVFRPGVKRFTHESLSGKLVCEFCSDKLYRKICFTCNEKINKVKYVYHFITIN